MTSRISYFGQNSEKCHFFLLWLRVDCKVDLLALLTNAFANPAQWSFREFDNEFIQSTGFVVLIISYIKDSMSIIKIGFSVHSFI